MNRISRIFRCTFLPACLCLVGLCNHAMAEEAFSWPITGDSTSRDTIFCAVRSLHLNTLPGAVTRQHEISINGSHIEQRLTISQIVLDNRVAIKYTDIVFDRGKLNHNKLNAGNPSPFLS